MGDPLLVGAPEFVRPPPLSGQGTGDLEHPAGGNPLHIASQVTPRDTQHLPACASQSGEKLSVLALHGLGPQGQFAAGGPTLVIGQERVVPGRRGEQPLGQAEHDNQVQVQTNPHAHRTDQYAFAHASHPTEVGLEFELQGSGEHVEFDRLLHRIEAGQSVESPIHPLGRLLLDRRPCTAAPFIAEERAHVSARPGDPITPWLWLGRCLLGIVDQPDHELAQRARPFRRSAGPLCPPLGRVLILFGLLGFGFAVSGEGGQTMVPVVPAGHDAGLTRQPFPRGHRERVTVLAQAPSGQPGEDVFPPESTVGQGKEPQQGATDQSGGEGHHCGTVEGDAGRRQLLMGQTGIGHRAGMKDGHPVERRPGPGRIDDASHCRPDLLVAIGDGQDPGAVGAHDVHGLAVAGMGAAPCRIHVDPAYRPLDLRVGPGVAGGPRQDDDVARRGHRAEERTTVAGQAFGQVDDHGAQTVGGGRVLLQRLGGRVEQVFLVVELRHQAGPRLPVKSDHVGGPVAALGQGIERAVGEVAQLPVGRHQGRLRGGMAGHRCEDPGLPSQGGSQRGGDDGCGDRPTTASGQLGRPKKLRQSVHREEGNGGHAAASTADRSERTRGQQAPSGHPDVIRRNDDGHRSERLVPFGRADGRPQFLGRRTPLPHPLDVDAHEADGRRRVFLARRRTLSSFLRVSLERNPSHESVKRHSRWVRGASRPASLARRKPSHLGRRVVRSRDTALAARIWR